MKEYIVEFVPHSGDEFAKDCETAINALSEHYEIDRTRMINGNGETRGILFVFRLTARERERQMYKKFFAELEEKEKAALAEYKRKTRLQTGVRSTNIRRLEENDR